MLRIAIFVSPGRKEVKVMMVNLFAMQVLLGWITMDKVPAVFKEEVTRIVEASK